MLSTEFGIPYYEIPVRTNKDRLGKFVLWGVHERKNLETESEIDKVSSKGKEVYNSDL